MKKLSALVFSVFLMLFLVGCGENTPDVNDILPVVLCEDHEVEIQINLEDGTTRTVCLDGSEVPTCGEGEDRVVTINTDREVSVKCVPSADTAE